MNDKTIRVKTIVDPDGHTYFDKDSLLNFLREDEIAYLRSDKMATANYIKSLIERIMSGTETEKKGRYTYGERQKR